MHRASQMCSSVIVVPAAVAADDVYVYFELEQCCPIATYCSKHKSLTCFIVQVFPLNPYWLSFLKPSAGSVKNTTERIFSTRAYARSTI
jgi:hypothetical protein